MYILKNGFIRECKKDPDWGNFIAPDRELENLADPNTKLDVYIPSGFKANLESFLYQTPNSLFDSIAIKIIAQRDKMTYEEQCSGRYYFDCCNLLQALKGKINRVAEVGTYLGGASCIFAGCIPACGFELDLIEANRAYLLYTYERIRRAFPESVAKIRLFLGDLPAYVQNVVQKENQTNILFHHDAGHNYNTVVNDLASLSFVKEKTHGLIIQDTHLRSGLVPNCVFVDAALYSVFGFDMKFFEIGVKFAQSSEPAYAGKSYFIDHQAEGFYIPFDVNKFCYPHPSMKLEEMDTVV